VLILVFILFIIVILCCSHGDLIGLGKAML